MSELTIGFIDTETTGLHPDRRAWEVGLILHRPGQQRREIEFTVKVEDLDMGNADRQALNIGGFYQRHPEVVDFSVYSDPAAVVELAEQPQSEYDVMRRLEMYTRNAHLIGINPAFDLDLLDRRMRYHDRLPTWHYSSGSNCIKTLIRGYLAGKGKPVPPLDTPTDDLLRAIGVDPNGFKRHTALGDARLAERAWFILHGMPNPGSAHVVPMPAAA